MYTEIVDLYQYYGFEKPENACAELQVFVPERLFADLRPGVLVLPGGGYQHVSAREGEPIALRFAAQGYAAFVLTYSILPCKFPTALREAAMAMRYIREKCPQWGVDPSRIAAMGFSAGGHLCGCLGMLYDCPEVADIAPAFLIRPDALGLCYPVTVEWGRTHEGTFANISGGDADLRKRLSLERLVREDMPPVFLWHTRNDPDVPCRNSLVLAAALEEKGVDFALHVYRNGVHGLATADTNTYAVADMPTVSPDVPGWIGALQSFFGELGFTMKEGRA